MGRFDGIDLGNDATMQRMVRSVQRKRAEIMQEMADLLRTHGLVEAPMIIEAKITEEAKKVA